MGDVIQFDQTKSIAEVLRGIADDIDSGEIVTESVTVIVLPDVWQVGDLTEEQASTDAVFNCTFAIHKLMRATEFLYE